MDNLKKCIACGKSFEVSEFHSSVKRGKPYRKPRCRNCANKILRDKTKNSSVPFMDLPNETWLPLFNGEYEISNELRIKSNKHPYVSKILTPSLGQVGYYVIRFVINGVEVVKLFHRLIGEVFIPNPNNYKTINHKNGIKTDNRIVNLEWCTYAYNNQHARQTGLNKPIMGEKSNNAKLKNAEVLEIFNSTKRGTEIAEQFNVSVDCVYDIRTGTTWSHLTHCNV